MFFSLTVESPVTYWSDGNATPEPAAVRQEQDCGQETSICLRKTKIMLTKKSSLFFIVAKLSMNGLTKYTYLAINSSLTLINVR